MNNCFTTKNSCSVLFASSAPASASGEGVLAEPGADSRTNSAMNLRMKGSGRRFPETSLTCTPESIAYKSGRRPIVKDRSYNIKWADMLDAINTELGSIVDPAISGSLPEEPQEITNVILTDIDVPDPETKAFDRTARTSTEGVKPTQAVSWFQAVRPAIRPRLRSGCSHPSAQSWQSCAVCSFS